MSDASAKAAENFRKTQEFTTKQLANSERAVESMIEFNSAVFSGGEIIAKKMYENYVSNIFSTFENANALNDTKELSDFYKTSNSNAIATAERLMDQAKGVAELSGEVMKETAKAGRLAYSKSFAVKF